MDAPSSFSSRWTPSSQPPPEQNKAACANADVGGGSDSNKSGSGYSREAASEGKAGEVRGRDRGGGGVKEKGGGKQAKPQVKPQASS